jgi:hypothetical protein
MDCSLRTFQYLRQDCFPLAHRLQRIAFFRSGKVRNGLGGTAINRSGNNDEEMQRFPFRWSSCSGRKGILLIVLKLQDAGRKEARFLSNEFFQWQRKCGMHTIYAWKLRDAP